ncbi:MAG: hypothetical protein V3R87_01340 [Dehalococcoidia bacterium]
MKLNRVRSKIDIMKQAARTDLAHLPLRHDKAPRWLFDRMTRLAREISMAVVIVT